MSRRFNYETKFDSSDVWHVAQRFPDNQNLIDFIESARAEAPMDLVLKHVQRSWGDAPYLFLLGYLGDVGISRDRFGRFEDE